MWKTDFYSSQWISHTFYQASFFSRWKIETFNPEICVGIFCFISYQNLCEVFLMFPLNVLYCWSIFPAVNTFSKTNVQPIVCSCKQLYKRFLHLKNYLGTVIHCWMILYCRCDSYDISPFLESINCWNIIFKYFIHTLFYLDFYDTATSKQVLEIKKSLWTLYRLLDNILEKVKKQLRDLIWSTSFIHIIYFKFW